MYRIWKIDDNIRRNDSTEPRERKNIKRGKAEEGSTLNKLLNKQGSPADTNVEQTGRRGGGAGVVRDIYRCAYNTYMYMYTVVRSRRESRRRNLLESSRRRQSVAV